MASSPRVRRARETTLAMLAVVFIACAASASALSSTSACACPTSGSQVTCAIENLVPADSSSTCDPGSMDADGFLDENIIIDGNTAVSSIDFSGLRRLGGALVVRSSKFVTALRAPDLVETVSGDVRIEAAIGVNNFLQTIDLKKLRVIGGSFAVVGETHASFTSLDVSELETVAGYFNVSDNSNLATLNVKNLRVVSNEGEVKISGNKATLAVRANCGVESSGLIQGVVTDSNARARSTFSYGSVAYCSLCTLELSSHSIWENGNYYDGATLGSNALKAYNSSYSCDSTLDAAGILNENLTLVVNNQGATNGIRYDLSKLRHVTGNLQVTFELNEYMSTSYLTVEQCNSTSTPSASSIIGTPRQVQLFMPNLDRVDGKLKVRIRNH
ncbi:unnamed product [Ostreococcus tauri]|uniref:Unnamed product n=1 Tax=Ostreococcus tauri TaxID=70448 RepID=A0A096PAI3_OSTTA|nr:unnamed product [Ostreococcus tauri]CEG01934.1 unnamed product [Ostreococcus tauri]|eukprot:XP_022841260.1 unnamed product [Ostreococcus tauri]